LKNQIEKNKKKVSILRAIVTGILGVFSCFTTILLTPFVTLTCVLIVLVIVLNVGIIASSIYQNSQDKDLKKQLLIYE
jgi:hypothetical protein